MVGLILLLLLFLYVRSIAPNAGNGSDSPTVEANAAVATDAVPRVLPTTRSRDA